MTSDTPTTNSRRAFHKPILLILLLASLAACTPHRVAPAAVPSSMLAESENTSSAFTHAERLRYEYSDQITDEDFALQEEAIPVAEEPRSIRKGNLPNLTLVRPTGSQTIASTFGMRFHPTMRRNILHTGIDIKGNRGDKAVAASGGTVVFSGRNGAYGLMIDIDAGNGVILRYAHLDKLAIKKGAKVKQGQYIGNVGRTGRVTAPHLHFEVRLKGKPVNPLAFFSSNHKWAFNGSSRKAASKKL